MTVPPLRRQVLVPLAPAEAYHRFRDDLGR